MSGPYKRCKCHSDEGKELGAKCPRLRRADGAWNPKHGTWYFRLELPAAAEGQPRRVMKRGGYASREAARDAHDAIARLMAIPTPGPAGAAARAEILALVEAALKARRELPDYDEVRRRHQTGQAISSTLTTGQWLTEWLATKKNLKRGTARAYGIHLRLYLIPHLGEIPLDKLRVGHISSMFDAIDAENERLAIVRATGTAAEQEAVRGRNHIGVATQHRIRATLRSALTSAIKQSNGQLIMFNPAAYVELPSGKRPKALVWTDERVAAWRANRARRQAAALALTEALRGEDQAAIALWRREVAQLDAAERPSPVMVWTAEQTGEFLDAVTDERLYPLYHLVAFRGLRRGEVCGVRWTDTDLDRGTLAVAEQLSQIGWEVEADSPKSDAGDRVVSLDAGTVAVLRRWRLQQLEDRMHWGAGWADSGRIFTREDGAQLHPASVTDRFNDLVAAAGLPPIRLHDLRHGAATLALQGGVDIKVVQEMLGHSSSSLTRDTYTSVVPRLAVEAAETIASMVPRKRGQVASGTDGLPTVSSGSTSGAGDLERGRKTQVKRGGPPGTRTLNPKIKSLLLCQLS